MHRGSHSHMLRRRSGWLYVMYLKCNPLLKENHGIVARDRFLDSACSRVCLISSSTDYRPISCVIDAGLRAHEENSMLIEKPYI